MRAAIIDTVRTPFVKSQGVLRRFRTVDLGVHVVSELLRRVVVSAADIDELIFGSVLHDPHIPQLAREVVLRSGLPKHLVAHTVSNNCITGLSALAWGVDSILSGRSKRVIVGGAESMSNPAITYADAGQRFFLDLARTKTLVERFKLFLGARPRFFYPKPPSPAEPSTGLTMGQHCELMVKEFKISRSEQDRIALESHLRAAEGYKQGILQAEISPIGGIESDNLVRADTTLEKLSLLKPVFDKGPEGSLTAGNSSALTDGASAVLIVSEDLAKSAGLSVLAYVEGIEFAAVPPGDGLLMAPGLALPNLLARLGLRAGDIDRFEVHEAFAGQVLANLHVWQHGWRAYPKMIPFGEIDRAKLNVYGGSLALGHPFAATGGRMVGSLARELHRHGLRRGVVSICAAGGLAGAVSLVRE